MSDMGKRVRITATYDVELRDELAVRDAGFKTRLANPAFAASYNEDEDDDVARALFVLFGHRLPKSVEGVHIERSTIKQEPITDVP
jgi:hypothetical protein